MRFHNFLDGIVDRVKLFGAVLPPLSRFERQPRDTVLTLELHLGGKCLDARCTDGQNPPIVCLLRCKAPVDTAAPVRTTSRDTHPNTPPVAPAHQVNNVLVHEFRCKANKNAVVRRHTRSACGSCQRDQTTTVGSSTDLDSVPLLGTRITVLTPQKLVAELHVRCNPMFIGVKLTNRDVALRRENRLIRG